MVCRVFGAEPLLNHYRFNGNRALGINFSGCGPWQVLSTLKRANQPRLSWWLQMSWLQVGTKPSATIIRTLFRLLDMIIHVNRICNMTSPLRWRHNGCNGVSNHQPHDCLLNRLFRRRSKKTSKLRVTGLCAGNSPETGEFPAQRASNAENVSIWWRHHALQHCEREVGRSPTSWFLYYWRIRLLTKITPCVYQIGLKMNWSDMSSFMQRFSHAGTMCVGFKVVVFYWTTYVILLPDSYSLITIKFLSLQANQYISPGVDKIVIYHVHMAVI